MNAVVSLCRCCNFSLIIVMIVEFGTKLKEKNIHISWEDPKCFRLFFWVGGGLDFCLLSCIPDISSRNFHCFSFSFLEIHLLL